MCCNTEAAVFFFWNGDFIKHIFLVENCMAYHSTQFWIVDKLIDLLFSASQFHTSADYCYHCWWYASALEKAKPWSRIFYLLVKGLVPACSGIWIGVVCRWLSSSDESRHIRIVCLSVCHIAVLSVWLGVSRSVAGSWSQQNSHFSFDAFQKVK